MQIRNANEFYSALALRRGANANGRRKISGQQTATCWQSATRPGVAVAVTPFSIVAKTLALLLATIVLQALVESTAQLPAFHYERPVLAWQLLVQLFAMVGSAKSWALLVWLGLLVMLVRGRSVFSARGGNCP